MRQWRGLILVSWPRATQFIWHLWSCIPFPEIFTCPRAKGNLKESRNKGILSPFPARLSLKGQANTVDQITHRKSWERGSLHSAHISFGINTWRRQLPAAPCSAPLFTPAALGSQLDFGNPALPNFTEFCRILAILTMQGVAMFAYTICYCLPAGGKALGCTLWEPLTCPPVLPGPGPLGFLNLEQLKWTPNILQETSAHLWQEGAHGPWNYLQTTLHRTRFKVHFLFAMLSKLKPSHLPQAFWKPFESLLSQATSLLSLQACGKVWKYRKLLSSSISGNPYKRKK